eukprot:3139584-Pyramimonas_sp.AAC.1
MAPEDRSCPAGGGHGRAPASERWCTSARGRPRGGRPRGCRKSWPAARARPKGEGHGRNELRRGPRQDTLPP